MNQNQNNDQNRNNVTNEMAQNGMEPNYGAVYPEIFYRIQPYIIMICDQLDTYYGNGTPGQDMMDQISENIYQDLIEMYPDLEEYARNYENQAEQPNVDAIVTRSPRIMRRRFRNRGPLRDIIDILFLSEFFRRRRKY